MAASGNRRQRERRLDARRRRIEIARPIDDVVDAHRPSLERVAPAQMWNAPAARAACARLRSVNGGRGGTCRATGQRSSRERRAGSGSRSRGCSARKATALTVAARRPEKLEAAAEGLRGRRLRRAVDRRRTSPTRRRSRRSSTRTASASGASTCSSTTPASASARRSARSQTKRIDMQLDINLRSIVIFYRECMPHAPRGRRRAQERARRQHLLDLRQARRGLAVGLLRHQARRRRLDRSDEQGDRHRGHQVDRALPRLRRHADDRLRQGARCPPRR